MKMLKIAVLITSWCLSFSVFAEHIRSDGFGGFYTDEGHVRDDGFGGYYMPDGSHVRSDGFGGYYR